MSPSPATSVRKTKLCRSGHNCLQRACSIVLLPDAPSEETEIQRNKQAGQGLEASNGEGKGPPHGGVCRAYCLVPL